MKLLNPVALEIKTQFETNDDLCKKVIGIFQLAANKTRFRIICTLAKGDFCVNEIAEIVGAKRLSNISQQLKMLRLAGLIESRRKKSKVIYSLTNEQVRHMITFLQEEFLSEEKT